MFASINGTERDRRFTDGYILYLSCFSLPEKSCLCGGCSLRAERLNVDLSTISYCPASCLPARCTIDTIFSTMTKLVGR